MDLQQFARDANDDMVWKKGEFPTTHEEVLQNLEHNGENANFLRAEAHKHSVDFDEDAPDQFNRNNN